MGTGAVTVRTAVAVFPVPPLAELTAPVVLVKVPTLLPVTLTATVQVALAATEPPVSEMVAPPTLAPAVPPQVSVSPLGADTTRPLGRVSVNATPASAVPVFGLVRVKVSVLAPLSGTEVGLKALAIDGGAMTMAVITTGSSGGAARHRAVVAVAVVGRDPVFGPGSRRRVPGAGRRAAGERLGVGEQRRPRTVRVVVQTERHRPHWVITARHGRFVRDRAAGRRRRRLLGSGDRGGSRGHGDRRGCR